MQQGFRDLPIFSAFFPAISSFCWLRDVNKICSIDAAIFPTETPGYWRGNVYHVFITIDSFESSFLMRRIQMLTA